ncbi:MAG TPA: hydroxyethylthiazole kinase [Xanthobacteraceae bacterium]|nr:hydroxyethylthiazole kinase [Xanthobacteraceae bacterium]
MRAPASELPVIAAVLLQRLRTQAPRVHCITNAVAQVITANALLAVGAVPSMTIAPEEVSAFIERAGALLINLGTLDAERRVASEAAISAAQGVNLPWVLDPVFVDRSPTRAAYAKALLARKPSAIRLNSGEFLTLSGTVSEPEEIAKFARANGVTVGLTGATDVISDGKRIAAIGNGDPLMQKVTALGCAESALVAACLAVERDAWRACAAALLIFGVAGELAGRRARGPGSFAVELLDELHGLDRDALVALARVS